MPTCSRATSTGRGSAAAGGHDLRLGRRQHLRPAAALLRRHGPASRRRGRRTSRVRASWRCSAIRSPPTTSRPAGIIAKDSPAAQLPDRARRRADGLQLVRRAARQPRGDDARHLRQHPDQERDARRHARAADQADARRRRDVDLRRRDGVPGAGRAAGRDRRQGVRHRLVARLGGQGHQPARA